MADILDLKVVALGRVYRRVGLSKLVSWAMEGRIATADLVCATGSDRWRSVLDVPELAASLPQGVARAGAAAEEEDAEFDVDQASQWVAQRPRRRPEEAEMDMTPMIDVTFQLLIFFMLTNHLANPAPTLLPEAVHGRGVDAEGRQAIVIDEHGDYYLGDTIKPEAKATSLDALVDEVRLNARAAGQPLDVIVSAHRSVKYVRLRELVERLGTVSNLGKILIGVEEKQ
ncbi:MAG TPA: biopolymer transporter ExbD [Pirellulales bacterium]|nr:biopolymer transporter ExbD [Pirellulales bacterium]